jgi:pyocin large subunit-like protein
MGTHPSAEDYASQASQFLERSQAEGLPTTIDPSGTILTYDPASNSFGSYNENGTTRTFFKPASPTYFDRQPGVPPTFFGGP